MGGRVVLYAAEGEKKEILLWTGVWRNVRYVNEVSRSQSGDMSVAGSSRLHPNWPRRF